MTARAADSRLRQHDDMEEMTAEHPLLQQRYFQLDRGPFRGDVLGLPLLGGLFWRSRANLGGHGTGSIPAGYQLVAMVGQQSRQEVWHDRRVGPTCVALGTADSGMEHRAGPNHESLAWALPLEIYLSGAESLGLNLPGLVDGQPVLALSPQSAATLRSVLDTVVMFAQLDPRLTLPGIPWLSDWLVTATLRCLGQPCVGRVTPGYRPAVARAARDLLHQKMDCALSISELCRQLKVSERTLRYQFALVYQCSPSEYHLALRLKMVRQRLHRTGLGKGAVCHAAAAFGFWHMGRFAQQYKALFGELPSQTCRADASAPL